MEEGIRLQSDSSRIPMQWQLSQREQLQTRGLKLDALIIIYPGETRYTLSIGVEVVPLVDLGHAK